MCRCECDYILTPGDFLDKSLQIFGKFFLEWYAFPFLQGLNKSAWFIQLTLWLR